MCESNRRIRGVAVAIPNVPPFNNPGWDAYDRVFLDILGVSS